MAHSKNNRVVDFLAGALFGALGGLVAGLLWAPRSGAESRHQITEGLREARDQTDHYLDDTKHQTEKVLHQVKHLMENKFSLLVDAVKAGKSAAQDKYGQMQSRHNGGEAVAASVEQAEEK